MVNRKLFGAKNRSAAAAADTINRAGGTAYRLSDEAALCQYVVTGTFHNAYYSDAREQLQMVQNLVDNVRPEIVAKAAAYGHSVGRMKDVPAYLLAELAARGELDWFKAAWPAVIRSPKMLLNFVQFVRSGVTGRKSFGSAVKRQIQDWITSRDGDRLFQASKGYSNPSLLDVIKMVHPRPQNDEQSALFAYLVNGGCDAGDWTITRGDTKYRFDQLPELAQSFEEFKYDNSNPLPDMDYRALTNCGLTPEHWKAIATQMPWNALRMNLNVLARNGVFESDKITKQVANKLADADEVRKWNAFPYQLLTTYQNIEGVPMSIKLALQDAMEVATENIPVLGKKVAFCIDLSGSMGSPVTGRSGKPTVTSCRDVAALMAASFARTNPECRVIAWADISKSVDFNPRDSVMTNSELFARQNVGYATNAGLALEQLNSEGWKGDVIVYVSDFQSWTHQNYGWGTRNAPAMAHEWGKFRKRNKGSKLISVNVQGYNDTQVPDDPNVLNIGGFNDAVFDVAANFIMHDNNAQHFVAVVSKTVL